MTDYVLVKTYPVDEYDVPGHPPIAVIRDLYVDGGIEWEVKFTPPQIEYIEFEATGDRISLDQIRLTLKYGPYALAFNTLITLVVLVAVMRWMAKNWR